MVLNDAGTIGFSLNGKSFPSTAPVVVNKDDWFEVHYFNARSGDGRASRIGDRAKDGASDVLCVRARRCERKDREQQATKHGTSQKTDTTVCTG